jgi:hypothetical protein
LHDVPCRSFIFSGERDERLVADTIRENIPACRCVSSSNGGRLQCCGFCCGRSGAVSLAELAAFALPASDSVSLRGRGSSNTKCGSFCAAEAAIVLRNRTGRRFAGAKDPRIDSGFAKDSENVRELLAACVDKRSGAGGRSDGKYSAAE